MLGAMMAGFEKLVILGGDWESINWLSGIWGAWIR